MNDEQLQLASAYLDGTLTAEERVRADADEDLAGAVEQLRAVRAALSAVEPPAPDRLESAIAAALAGFAAPSEPLPRPGPREGRARRRGSWLMPVAAAAVVVVAIGGVTVALLGSGSTDDAADAPSADVLATVPAGDVFVAADTIARAESDGEAATDAAAGSVAAAEATTVAGDVSPRLLATPEDLVSFVADATRAVSQDGGDSPCDEGQLLGRAAYLVDDGEVIVDVFRAIDTAGPGSEALAVAVDDCTIVARAPVP